MFPAGARSLFKKSVGVSARTKLVQAGRAVAHCAVILIVATLIAAASYLLISSLTDGLPPVVSIIAPWISALIVVDVIVRRLRADSAFRAALASARLLLDQALHHIVSRGDGGVAVGSVDPHETRALSQLTSAAANDAAAALLYALASLAKRILASTLFSSSSLRGLAMA